MKNYIIVAAISAVVSVFTWEVMHNVTGTDTPKPQKENREFVWRKHV